MLAERRSGAFALLLSLPLLLLAPGAVRSDDSKPAADPARLLSERLRTLRMSPGIVADQVIVFPLYLTSAPAEMAVGATVHGTGVLFSEPEPRLGKLTVRAANGSGTTALVLAGTVLEGGRRDRLVRFDRLIPVGEAIEIDVLPASMAQDARAEGKDFRIADFLSPSYLRESGQFSPDSSVAPRFVSHFLEFRNPSDKRKSLVAIGESDALADYCLSCQQAFSEWPSKRAEGTAVGAILFVRGRIQSMEVFATNDHLKTFLAPLLKSLAFPAAAISLRAKKLEIPLPGADDPAAELAAAQKSAEALLANLDAATFSRRKTDDAFVGEAWVVRLKDGARGTALWHAGRLVHAAVYPGDPFEDALYSQPLDPIDPADSSGGDEIGASALDRRSGPGYRLTPAEQRLLERLRERRLPVIR